MSEKTKKVILPNENLKDTGINNGKDTTLNNNEKDDYGYVKQIYTEQDVYTSGIIYRYINNVDPNKDLITDTAKIGGPLKIVTVKDNVK